MILFVDRISHFVLFVGTDGGDSESIVSNFASC